MFNSKQKKEIATVKHFESELEVALKELDEAKTSFSEALTESVSGEAGSIERLKVARKARELAISRVSDAEDGVRTTKAKYADACKAEYEEMIRKRWNEARDITKNRVKLSKEIENQATALAASVQRLIDLGVKAHEAAPKTDSALHASLLSSEKVMGDFRMYLLKLGWSWAIAYPWGPHTVPTFSETVADGSSWLMKLADEA